MATNHPQVERAKFGYSQKKTRTPVDNFWESCQVLVISKNTVAKHGDFHVFLLTRWRTKRHRKRILWQREKTFEKVSRRCEISHKTIWLSRQDTQKLPPVVWRGIPDSRGLSECGKKRRLFRVFQTFPRLFSHSSLWQHAVYFVSNGGCWPHLSESPRFKQFFSRFCRFYDPSVTKEGDPQHVPKALRVNQESPEHHAWRNGS